MEHLSSKLSVHEGAAEVLPPLPFALLQGRTHEQGCMCVSLNESRCELL